MRTSVERKPKKGEKMKTKVKSEKEKKGKKVVEEPKKKGRPAKSETPKKQKEVKKVKLVDKSSKLEGVRVELTAYSTVTYSGTVVGVAGDNLLVSIRRKGSSLHDIHTFNKADILSMTAGEVTKGFASLVGVSLDITLKAITRVLEVEKKCTGVVAKDGFITTVTTDGGEYWVNQNAEYIVTADDPGNADIKTKRGRKPKDEVEDLEDPEDEDPEDLEDPEDEDPEDEDPDLEDPEDEDPEDEDPEEWDD